MIKVETNLRFVINITNDQSEINGDVNVNEKETNVVASARFDFLYTSRIEVFFIFIIRIIETINNRKKRMKNNSISSIVMAPVCQLILLLCLLTMYKAFSMPEKKNVREKKFRSEMKNISSNRF